MPELPAEPLLEVRDLAQHVPVRAGVLFKHPIARVLVRLEPPTSGIARYPGRDHPTHPDTRRWKAQQICAESEPELATRGGGHPSACHFAEERSVVP